MSIPDDPLERIHARRRLEEINTFLLHGEGEIAEAPGKLSLVWTDPADGEQRFLAVKAAGEADVLINGRRYPATGDGLKQGLRAGLAAVRGDARRAPGA